MEILKGEDMTTPRPTAGHPRDKFGEFPGHDKTRRKIVPTGREQTKNVRKDINKDTEKFSNEEPKRNICSTDLSERDEPKQHKMIRGRDFVEGPLIGKLNKINCIKVLENHFGRTDLEKTVDAWRDFLNVEKTKN